MSTVSSCHSSTSCFCSCKLYRECQFNEDNNRIETDILTTGYIRQIVEMIHKLSIPMDIKDLCFNFWYLAKCPKDLKLVEQFYDMDLTEDLLRGIYAYGYEKASRVQQKAIMPLIQGRDIIVQSQSGTGKSTSICIAALQRLDLLDPYCQVIIINPTRSNIPSMKRMIKYLGTYLDISDSSIHISHGGLPIRDESTALAQGKQIVIGTQSRINFMIARGVLSLKSLKMFILYDTDEIFSRGFKDEIYKCFQYLPSDIQGIMPYVFLFIIHRQKLKPLIFVFCCASWYI